VYEQLLRGAGVQLLQGWATLCDAHTVQVRTADGDQRITRQPHPDCHRRHALVPAVSGREHGGHVRRHV
jgi:hypothetical protein